MHEDDMAESLVALSRSGEYSEKTEGVEYVVDTIEVSNPPVEDSLHHQLSLPFNLRRNGNNLEFFEDSPINSSSSSLNSRRATWTPDRS